MKSEPGLSTDLRLQNLRTVCRCMANRDHETAELLSETWIATQGLTEPKLIRIKARQRILDIFRYDQIRKSPERLQKAQRLLESEINPESDQDRVSQLSILIDSANLDTASRELLYQHYYRGRTFRDMAKDSGESYTKVFLKVREALEKIKLSGLQTSFTG